MGGEEEGLTSALPEQLAPLLESELLRYLSGAIAGGAIGDVVQGVVSGVIVEVIVDVFIFVGLGDLVVTSPPVAQSQSASSSASGDGASSSSTAPASDAVGGPTTEVQIAGTLIAIAVFLYVVWRVVRPRLQPLAETKRQRLLVDGGLATVSAGVVAGGLLGLTAAIVVSAFVGIATIELFETGRLEG